MLALGLVQGWSQVVSGVVTLGCLSSRPRVHAPVGACGRACVCVRVCLRVPARVCVPVGGGVAVVCGVLAVCWRCWVWRCWLLTSFSYRRWWCAGVVHPSFSAAVVAHTSFRSVCCGGVACGVLGVLGVLPLGACLRSLFPPLSASLIY